MVNKKSVQLTSIRNGKTELSSDEIEPGVFRTRTGRTLLEKILLFVVVLTTAAAIAACVAIAVVVTSRKDTETDTEIITQLLAGTTTPSVPGDGSVCTTADCVSAATRIHSSIDYTIQPCDNFFDFACGSWIKKHPIPEDRGSIEMYQLLQDDIEIILKDLLETPSKVGELEAITKAKNVYLSCINESIIEGRGLDPLEGFYKNTAPWSVLDPATYSETKFDLVEMLIMARKYNVMPLMAQGVDYDYKNSTATILVIDQPSGLMLPGRDYYLSRADTSIPALKSYLTILAEALGATNMTRVKQDVNDILEFETQIANLTIPVEERRDSNVLYNKMTIQDLYTNVSDKFDWKRYLSGVMSLSGVGISLMDHEPVVVQSPVYLSNLMDFLQKTPNRTIANYIMTFMTLNRLTALPAHIEDLAQDYNKIIYGQNTKSARWKRCVSKTNENLGATVGRMFVDATFDEESKIVATEMISDLRTALKGLINENEWMDDTTREVAIDKADAIFEKIGYSDKEIKNDTNLNKRYENITFRPNDYFANDVAIDMMAATKNLKQLRKPVDKSLWAINTPAVVDAYYNPTANDITFPAGGLQPPYFHKNYPKYLNYGGIGTVIGHEMTHGFDDEGRQYDKDGNLRDWWNPGIVETFRDKVNCMVVQYSQYYLDAAGLKVNGNRTQGENIADNGGLKEGYSAYRALIKRRRKEEPFLPGLKFNPNQLFFINFAQVWCQSYRPEAAIASIITDVHSPGRFRVIGALQNSDDFSAVFNCPRTSYMNAKNKCKVW